MLQLEWTMFINGTLAALYPLDRMCRRRTKPLDYVCDVDYLHRDVSEL